MPRKFESLMASLALAAAASAAVASQWTPQQTTQPQTSTPRNFVRFPSSAELVARFDSGELVGSHRPDPLQQVALQRRSWPRHLTRSVSLHILATLV